MMSFAIHGSQTGWYSIVVINLSYCISLSAWLGLRRGVFTCVA